MNRQSKYYPKKPPYDLFRYLSDFNSVFLDENSEKDLWGTPTFFKMRNSEDIPKFFFKKHYKKLIKKINFPLNRKARPGARQSINK